MLDTFKARLKAKLKAAGVNLSQKRIDAFADRLHKKNPDVKEDSEHDELIDQLDELVSFSDIAKQDDTIRDLGGKLKKQEAQQPPKPEHEDDETEDEEDEEEEETPSKGKKKSKQEKEKPSRMPKWAKLMMTELQGLKAEKSKATIKAKIAEQLKGDDENAGVPEKVWAKRFLPEKEEDIEAFVAEVKADWADITKDNPVAEKTEEKPLNGGHKPTRGGKNTGKPDQKKIDAVLDNILPQTVKAKT